MTHSVEPSPDRAGGAGPHPGRTRKADPTPSPGRAGIADPGPSPAGSAVRMPGSNSHPRPLPGRDRRAVRIPGPAGRSRSDQSRHVLVIGGGIAGLAAATALAERGVDVTIIEAEQQLGGRVRSWPAGDGRTMSRGFHAFFRQYYNLRSLLRRADPDLAALTPLRDYPLVRSDGMRDSFRRVPKTPPWSILGFVLQSPSFTARSLARVNVRAALELLRVRFPDSYREYDGQSAADFLARLRFPADARALALEVFARSFFANPEDFAAGELVAMFHTYFLGSGEGLLFDVPVDDYDTALWAPLGQYLARRGVTIRTGASASDLHLTDNGVLATVDGELLEADAALLATDPRAARGLIAGMGAKTTGTDGAGTDSIARGEAGAGPVGTARATGAAGISPDGTGATRTTSAAGMATADVDWQRRAAATRNAPPFMVVRLWLDGPVRAGRAAFLGTTGFGALDNVSVLERFEAGARRWSRDHGGSVVELHAYACGDDVISDSAAQQRIAGELEDRLHQVYPETARLAAVHREVLTRDDCTLITPHGWSARPGVTTPWPSLALAGDWVRCDYPVALMERAATTGFLAANSLLARWGVAGHDIWTVPLGGLLTRRRYWPAPRGRGLAGPVP